MKNNLWVIYIYLFIYQVIKIIKFDPTLPRKSQTFLAPPKIQPLWNWIKTLPSLTKILPKF